MNRYLNKLIMYQQVNRMKRDGHSISHISKFLGINWRTVKKMLSMDDRQYEAYLSSQIQRPEQLTPYEHFVKQKLDSFPGTSASQIHDWLKEYVPVFPDVHPETVYNFVMRGQAAIQYPKRNGSPRLLYR